MHALFSRSATICNHVSRITDSAGRSEAFFQAPFRQAWRWQQWIFCSDQPIRSFRQLYRRKDRFECFLRNLSLPKPKLFTAFEKEYRLPLYRHDAPPSTRHVADLEYLIGFFDGDGCVSVQTNLSGCQLKVSHSIHHGEVLVKLLNSFGGVIRACRGHRGTKRAVLEWRIGGGGCRRAAIALGSADSLKQAQLLIAANWPDDIATRKEKASELRFLKQSHHPNHVFQSWERFAGFFDAEGCIYIDPCAPHLSLHISQKQEPALNSIGHLVQNTYPWVRCLIYRKRTHSTLTIRQTSSSKFILERLLDSGLLEKKQAAEIALSMNISNHLEVRQALSRVVGLQGRYRRLDDSGCQTARRIKNLRARLRYLSAGKGGAEDIHKLQQQISELVDLRNQQKMSAAVDMLRKDIRKLFRQGAKRD